MTTNINIGLDILRDTLLDFLSAIINSIPTILGAIVVLIFGFLVAWFGSKITVRLIRWIKLERLAEKTPVKNITNAIGYSKGIVELLGKLVYWTIFLIFVSTACKIIGLEEVANVINSIFAYIPKIVASLIILVLGTYIAKILRDTVITLFESANISYSKYAGNGAQIITYLFVMIVVLDQLGFDTYIIISNMNIIIAGAALAFAIAFGLASRKIVRNFLAMRLLKKLIREKNIIELPHFTGKLISMNLTGVFLQDDRGNRHFFNAEDILDKFVLKVENE